MELNQTEIGFTEASLLKQGYHLQLNARRSELDPERTGELSSIPVNEGSFVFESHRPGSAAPKVVKYTTSASPRRPSEVSTQKWQINSGILRNGLIFTATTRTNQGRLTTRHTYSFTLMTGDNSSLEKATEITFHIDTLDERRRHSIDAAVEFAQGIQKIGGAAIDLPLSIKMRLKPTGASAPQIWLKGENTSWHFIKETFP